MRVLAAALAATLLALAGPGLASAISVTPIRLVLSPATPLGTFTVVNEGPTPARVQLTLNQWRQEGGTDQLTPVREVLVNPTIFEVPGNNRQLVRLGLQVPVATVERSYRLIVDEIPTPEQMKAGTVGMRLRISVPLFVPVDGAKFDLDWKATAKAGVASFTVSNAGRRHAQILHVKVSRASGPPLLDSGASIYVLPGATMPAALKLNGPVTPGETLRIDLKTDDGDAHASVRVDAS